MFNCHPKGGVIAMAYSRDAKHLVTLGAEEVQVSMTPCWNGQIQLNMFLKNLAKCTNL